MKSIIIQTKGDRIPATLRLICTQGFGVSKEAEIRLIETIYNIKGFKGHGQFRAFPYSLILRGIGYFD